MAESRGVWFEDAEDVDEALDWGTRKAQLLRWVQKNMRQKLTRRERNCIELYYFRSMSFEDVGKHTRTTASSSHRAVSRAVRKLRVAAREDDSWKGFLRRATKANQD
jgi:DNA-directed RNA polymerase specialized sigma subunit